MQETTADIAGARSLRASMSTGRIEVMLEGILITGPARPTSHLTATLNDKPIHEKAKKVRTDRSEQLEYSCAEV